MKFGEKVEGYNIPVLNEREVRASAGILFLGAFISLMLIMFEGNFTMAKYFVIIFLVDFIIRVYINTRLSPSLIVGRMIVSNQTPEYVGAQQKKFAWTIGVILGISMFFLLIVFNSYSFISGLICLICLLFLFFEASFGICLGCIFYKWFYKEKAQYCPGEVCDINNKEEIQKISKSQIILLIAFIAIFTFISIHLLNDILNIKPELLWEMF